MNWDEIAQRHGTDKAARQADGQGHNYLPDYEEILGPIPVERLLEIGVDSGASVRMWAEIFPAAMITGVDIRPECAVHAGDRIDIEIVDATNPEGLTDIAQRRGPFDVIVDDGSHIPGHVIVSFDLLWPFTTGVYVVEDLLWPEAWWVVGQLALRGIRTVTVRPDTGERTLISIRR